VHEQRRNDMIKKWTPLAGVIGFGIAAYAGGSPPAVAACYDGNESTVYDCYNSEGYCGPVWDSGVYHDGTALRAATTYMASCIEVCDGGYFTKTYGHEPCGSY
jgi:hypothetical protein